MFQEFEGFVHSDMKRSRNIVKSQVNKNSVITFFKIRI